MKFSVDLTRHDAKTVEVFAVDRDVAARLAADSYPGFHVESATELPEPGVEGGSWSVIGSCEGCGTRIWEHDTYAATEDAQVCAACMA